MCEMLIKQSTVKDGTCENVNIDIKCEHGFSFRPTSEVLIELDSPLDMRYVHKI